MEPVGKCIVGLERPPSGIFNLMSEPSESAQDCCECLYLFILD